LPFKGEPFLADLKFKPHYKSVKGIFCLRLDRFVDAYRSVSMNNRLLPVNHANRGDILNVRFYPMAKGLIELHFWGKDYLLDVQQLKTKDLKGVQF